jgi:tetratricopeptide (TPR) repeat protein
MELRYITNGMSSPEGKPKVYFSCHPADFDTAFPMIPEDILRHVNCAVWYDPDMAAVPDPGELEEIFGEMQLVVFAVSSHFLYEKNRAKDLELPLALDRHIPILPVMLENGLGYEFSNRCAKIQVVARYVTDPTATPYEEVLDSFLSSVLVGDKLAQKVRDAFDAYVFLSYRKKDRRHAHRLMRLIHENEAFRDIAIWYDEFLVPGEGFNEAIKDAFEKSSLFAMAVTPHLEEEGNYVMRVEYPMARDRQSREEGFGVIPVEMYEPEDAVNGRDWRIDPANLRHHEEFKYREIPDLRDEHRRPELSSAFLEALGRIARKEHDGSARHRFFIGLAYLNGIDVETDYGKALELLQSAAQDEDPCMEATAKLAEMYLHGEGVRFDQAEAVRWQKLLSSQYLESYDRNHDPDAHKGFGTQYFRSLLKLSDMERDCGDHREAMETLRQALAFSEKLEEEVGVREQERDLAILHSRMGGLCRDLGDAASARDYYTKACRIYERQAREMGTQRARRDLSVSYERLGDLCRKQGDPAGAEDYYEKAKAIREALACDSLSCNGRRDLSAILTKIGNLRKAAKQYTEAEKYYAEALEMDRVLAAELRTPQAQDDYGVSLTKAGDIRKALGDLPGAAAYYEQALTLFENNIRESESRIFLDHYAGGCEKLASAYKKTGNTQEAARLYRESVKCRENLHASSPTPSAAHALAAACFNAAAFLKDRGLMHRAFELWDSLSRFHPEYRKYRDRAARHLS